MKKILYTVLGAALTVPGIALAQRGGYHMSGYREMDGFGFFVIMGGIVWILVGVLAAIWLWQHVSKK